MTGPLFYSPDAYALPTGLTFGDSGRNTLNLPRRVNFDAGLFKRFQIKERAAFEFRWEMFNIFNHTEFNAIDTTLRRATASCMQPARTRRAECSSVCASSSKS